MVGRRAVEAGKRKVSKVTILDGPKGQGGGEKKEDDIVEGEWRELGEKEQTEQEASVAKDQTGNQESGTEEKAGEEKKKDKIFPEDLAKLVRGGTAALPYLRGKT